MIPRKFIRLMKEKNVGERIILPQIMLMGAGGFLLMLGLFSLLHYALAVRDEFVESTPDVKFVYIISIALFGTGFILLGAFFKKAGKRKFVIYIIMSIMFLFFFGGYMYYELFMQSTKINNMGGDDNNIDSIIKYIYFGLLILIQTAPVVVIGFYIRKYEKKVRLERKNEETCMSKL